MPTCPCLGLTIIRAQSNNANKHGVGEGFGIFQKDKGEQAFSILGPPKQLLTGNIGAHFAN